MSSYSKLLVTSIEERRLTYTPRITSQSEKPLVFSLQVPVEERAQHCRQDRPLGDTNTLSVVMPSDLHHVLRYVLLEQLHNLVAACAGSVQRLVHDDRVPEVGCEVAREFREVRCIG